MLVIFKPSSENDDETSLYSSEPAQLRNVYLIDSYVNCFPRPKRTLNQVSDPCYSAALLARPQVLLTPASKLQRFA